MDIFFKIVKINYNETLFNLCQFFVKCIIESDDFAKFILDDKKK